MNQWLCRNAALGAALFVTRVVFAEHIGVFKISGYTYTDPLKFGGVWETDSVLELNRSLSECNCKKSAESTFWESFLEDLKINLDGDPTFRGPWVHALCGSVYPHFFRLTSSDDVGLIKVHGDCSAGLLSMAVVCMQSVALEILGVSTWQRTDRVVMEEGESVGDAEGQIALAACLQWCEENPVCASVAYGSNGCHLKDRCVQLGEEIKPPGESSDGYRTYFRVPCRREETISITTSRANSIRTQTSTRKDELFVFADMSTRLLERAAGCLADSDWPFSIAEILDNYIELIADTGHFEWSRAHGLSGLVLGLPTALETSPPDVTELEGHARVFKALPKRRQAHVGAVRRVLQRCLIRWARGLRSEVGFWHNFLLASDDENAEVQMSEADKTIAKQWIEAGDVRWTWDDLCKYLDDVWKHHAIEQYGKARVLNAGSGPLAPGPISCEHKASDRDKQAVVEPTSVVSADGLARFYLRIFDMLNIQPLHQPLQCPVEALRRCFPRNHFDIVHIRNALDHAVDPLLGLSQMLEVVRPGGWVLLRHARNEGVPGHFQFGLHQWAFDVSFRLTSPSFIIWSPALRADVTSWLLGTGLAAEVHTSLQPHPGGGSPGEKYVFVDIRKPSEDVIKNIVRTLH